MTLDLSAATAPSLSVIVLAGGRSSRMGRDKALISIGGVPLLSRICQVARQCSDRVFVVTPWIERYQPILQEIGPGSIQFIPEAPSSPSPGPLVGFGQGLAQIESDWVLLLACDLPQLQVKVLQQWIALLPQVSSTTVALLPRHPEGWWEPLCGFYRSQCRLALEAFIQQGGRSFQQWLADQSVQALPLTEPNLLFNCNTPEDLKQIDPSLFIEL